MRLLSYGEDSLTLWAITIALPEFLKKLNDETPQDRVTVIYRPSFGRHSSRAVGSHRSEFGEFDAILSTDSAVYLVEAKWGSSSELQDGIVRLRPEQRHRHDVFRWYLQNWRHARAPQWTDFREAHSGRFVTQFPRMAIPSVGTTLANNLEFVLNELPLNGRQIRDVLLFTAVSDDPTPRGVDPSHFFLVTMRATPIGGAGYISLSGCTSVT